MFNEKRYEILKMLLDRLGEEVSGEAMSRKLVISRAAIAKHIKKLRTLGFDIFARPGGGYTLEEIPQILNEELIRAYSRRPFPVRLEDVVKSTNIDAKEWAEENGDHGAMLVAKTQTAGRGRRQRIWQSVEGGIWSSIILKLDIPPSRVQPATLAAAMAVSQAIMQNCPTAEPYIKWPNDILVNGKKVCGILTEFIGDIDELRYLIVGIGINNDFDATKLEGELLNKATSLRTEKIYINSSKLIANVRDNLLDITDIWCRQKSIKHIIDFYRDNMAFKSQRVSVRGAGIDYTGILQDIDTDGALIIATGKGQEKVISGEISVRRT